MSTVTPMHNEEACVAEFVRRTDAVLSQIGCTYEIIVVDDGSTDATETCLRELALRYPSLRAIVLARNMGQCSALDAGIQHSRGERVVVLDGDLQNRPEDIPALLETAERGFDLVSALRLGRAESKMMRRVPSGIANWLLRRVTGCPVRDMGGFKCMHGDLARSLRLRAGQHRLLPALVWQRGGRVTEIPVHAAPRFAGKSHYGLNRTLDVLIDIVMLWFQSSFKSRPIYLFGRIALVLLAIDAIIMPILLYQRLVLGVDLGTRPPFLIAIMLFLSALFVLASGLVLELVSDTLSAANGSRGWVVREQISGVASSSDLHERASNPAPGARPSSTWASAAPAPTVPITSPRSPDL